MEPLLDDDGLRHKAMLPRRTPPRQTEATAGTFRHAKQVVRRTPALPVVTTRAAFWFESTPAHTALRRLSAFAKCLFAANGRGLAVDIKGVSDVPSTTPPAGWYPDPAETSVIRWWDGNQWTSHLQPAPHTAEESSRPDWLTNRGAVTAVIAFMLVASVIFTFVGVGGGDEDTSPGTVGVVAVNGADAAAQARLAQTAIETYSTEHNGQYAGADLPALQAIDARLSGAVSLETQTTGYAITAAATSGASFTVTRNPSGPLAYSCVPAGADGCPASGDWSAGLSTG